MNTIQSITVVEDVTLISLQDSPADINLISKIFEMISNAGIDVDMISHILTADRKRKVRHITVRRGLGNHIHVNARI